MGRPLHKRFFGNPATSGNQFNVEAWIPSGSGAVVAYILEQKTNTTYIVTDDSDTGRCKLQAGTLTGPGQMRITAMPFGFDIATATSIMQADVITSIATGGTGYEPGEIVELISAGTISEFTRVKVTVGNVALDSATVIDAGTGSTPGDVLVIVGGTPQESGGTLLVNNVDPVSATVIAAGTGYVPGEVITLSGGVTIGDTAKVTVTNVAAISAAVNAGGSGYDPGDTATLATGTGTKPIFTITNVEVFSETVSAGGDGYSVADTLTLSSGAFFTAAIFNIDSVGTVVGQDETDFTGSTFHGTFAPGTGYSASDVITLDDGTTVTVDAVSTGAVTAFTITTGSTSGTTDNVLRAQSSVAPTGGTNFTLTLGIVNQAVFSVGITATVGDYTSTTGIGATSTTGSGLGATLTATFSVLAVSVTTPGDLTAIFSTPTATSSGDGGSGLTVTPVYEILIISVTDGTKYTTLTPTTTLQASSTLGGSAATFSLVWGVNTATPVFATVYTSIPLGTVLTTNGGGDATFDLDWSVASATVTTPGQYFPVPNDPVAQLVSSGSGTGASFNINWNVFAVTITAPGGGYVAPPLVTFSGSAENATGTTVLTTVGGSTPPDEAIASVTVNSAGSGYSAAAAITIAAPAGDIEYVRILNAHQVKTFEGNTYSWDEFLADSFDEADVDIT